jgi:DNA-binding transcriptional MerR regulator
MTQSLVLQQEVISAFQTLLEMLERCLNGVSEQDEAKAEIIELINSRGISLNELKEVIKQLREKFNKTVKAFEKFIQEVKNDRLTILYFVRCCFLVKELIDEFWNFFLDKSGTKALRKITEAFVRLYREFKSQAVSANTQKDEIYILTDALKHSLQSIIRAALRVNALSQEEINALDLGDITPQESETMLIFLSTKKRWEPVYKRLAES